MSASYGERRDGAVCSNLDSPPTPNVAASNPGGCACTETRPATDAEEWGVGNAVGGHVLSPDYTHFFTGHHSTLHIPWHLLTFC